MARTISATKGFAASSAAQLAVTWPGPDSRSAGLLLVPAPKAAAECAPEALWEVSDMVPSAESDAAKPAVDCGRLTSQPQSVPWSVFGGMESMTSADKSMSTDSGAAKFQTVVLASA